MLLLGIPLLLFARHAYTAQTDQITLNQAQTLASLTRESADSGTDSLQTWLAEQHSLTTASVVLPSGQRLGKAPACTSPQPKDESMVRWTCGNERLASVRVSLGQDHWAHIDVGIAGSRVGTQMRQVLVLLSFAVVILPAFAVLVADRLGRSVVRACADLVNVADRLRRGDLHARSTPSGPPELVRLGMALSTLAARINALIINEREAVADLSHRLRTPITSLVLQAENISDADQSKRLLQGLDGLNNEVSRIIRQARHPIGTQGGLTTRLDKIVRERADFWSALAEDQGRACELAIDPHPCRVDVPRPELEAAIDALLENVFAHTPEGTGMHLTVTREPSGGALLVLADDGPGFADDRVVERGHSTGGSSGLGLDIARRTAVMSGGHMVIGHSPTGGAQVTLLLGGQADPPPAPAAI
ncbi:sensor histidine kinase [Streptomyces vinaceus]|uniref:sensor histidine kinase n=1 Tax=Streptomyces vinaceus TaxID=1960 RepID=UPI00381AB5C8